MDGIRQERHNEDLILNFNKRFYRQILNEEFGTHVQKSMVFKTLKNKQCIIPRNKAISGKPIRGI